MLLNEDIDDIGMNEVQKFLDKEAASKKTFPAFERPNPQDQLQKVQAAAAKIAAMDNNAAAAYYKSKDDDSVVTFGDSVMDQTAKTNTIPMALDESPTSLQTSPSKSSNKEHN